MTILTEDNRSARLRSLTAGWNTNWNKHSVPYSEILSGGPPRDGIRSEDVGATGVFDPNLDGQKLITRLQFKVESLLYRNRTVSAQRPVFNYRMNVLLAAR